MDYRVKYRDIPWPVAIMVLPGKIIGRLIITPIIYCIKNWHSILTKILTRYVFILILIPIYVIVNSLTKGDFSAWILHILAGLKTLFFN